MRPRVREGLWDRGWGTRISVELGVGGSESGCEGHERLCWGGGCESELCVLRQLYLTVKPYALRALPFD